MRFCVALKKRGHESTGTSSKIPLSLKEVMSSGIEELNAMSQRCS